MRLDIYLKETRLLTELNRSLLDEVRIRIQDGQTLSKLEQSGVLHALQVLIENAIGKARHTLKHLNITVPISAYEVFEALAENEGIEAANLDRWHAVIGLRNKIVHDYMNINPDMILQLIRSREDDLVTEFLLNPLPEKSK